jgi:hypothetical protein
MKARCYLVGQHSCSLGRFGNRYQALSVTLVVGVWVGGVVDEEQCVIVDGEEGVIVVAMVGVRAVESVVATTEATLDVAVPVPGGRSEPNSGLEEYYLRSRDCSRGHSHTLAFAFGIAAVSVAVNDLARVG